jgi:hypothetical protein
MGPEKLWPDPELDTYSLERCLRHKGYQWIAGLDEVGRGPLVGRPGRSRLCHFAGEMR